MVSLPDEITYACAAACLSALTTAVEAEAGGVIEIDAAPVARFDSSALAVMLALGRTASRLGKRFSVLGLAPHLHELATLYGVESLVAGSAG